MYALNKESVNICGGDTIIKMAFLPKGENID